MERVEMMKQMSTDELALYLCDEWKENGECDNCPATTYCYRGHTGMRDYLREEVDYD